MIARINSFGESAGPGVADWAMPACPSNRVTAAMKTQRSATRILAYSIPAQCPAGNISTIRDTGVANHTEHLVNLRPEGCKCSSGNPSVSHSADFSEDLYS